MWGQTLFLVSLVLKISSIFVPGVEVTISENNLEFKCNVTEYFRSSKLLDSDFNQNISSVEFTNCLAEYGYFGDNRSFIVFSGKNLFTSNIVKSIVIESKVNLKISWDVNTLNSLESLSLTIPAPTDQNEAANWDGRLQLNEFKKLKSLKLDFAGSFLLCENLKFEKNLFDNSELRIMKRHVTYFFRTF